MTQLGVDSTAVATDRELQLRRDWLAHSVRSAVFVPLVVWLSADSGLLITGLASLALVIGATQLVWSRADRRGELPSAHQLLNLNFAMLCGVMLSVDGAWPIMVFPGLFAVGVLWMLEHRWTAFMHLALILGVGLNPESLMEPVPLAVAILIAMSNTALIITDLAAWRRHALTHSLKLAGSSRWVIGSDGAISSMLGASSLNPSSPSDPDGALGSSIASWIASNPQVGASFEFEDRSEPEGEPIWKRATVEQIHRDDRWLLVADITSERVAAERLRYEATHDVLTGLQNRPAFATELVAMLDRGEVCSLFMVDLDRFKDVNDSFGHAVGDDLLRLVGQRLDRLEGIDEIARLGGDEFGLLAPIDDPSAIEQIGRSIVSALSDTPFAVGNLSLSIGSSVGSATTPVDATDARQLQQRADLALYAAKESGAGWLPFDDERDRGARRRLDLNARLPFAIERQELGVYHQPKVSFADRSVQGSEALVRWHHPVEGLLSPGAFLPLVFVSGCIDEVTMLVLDQALADLVVAESANAELTVSVNIDGRSLSDPSFPQSILDALDRHNVACDRLWIELTEAALVEPTAQTRSALDQLAEAGVQISVDDFGTGYSSLSYLGHLPVNEIKLDRVLVEDIASSSRSLSIARAIISLAHDLAIQVTAEGIEDEETFRILRDLGCDYAQGYLFAMPMASEQYVDFAKDHSPSNI